MRFEADEGVVRTHLVTEVPEIDSIPMWNQVRRFGEDKYFFPIKGVHPYVHDLIAESVDTDITGPLVLGRHMDLYSADFQERKLLPLAGKVVTGINRYAKPDETLEQTFNSLLKETAKEINMSEKESNVELGTVEFAFRMGEAVAYTHLKSMPYDTERTYLPSRHELAHLLRPYQAQIVRLAGLHAAWQATHGIENDLIDKPSPFKPLINMCAWGGRKFKFVGNDFYYDVATNTHRALERNPRTLSRA